ncbi:putative quinol monooxygenase [Sphingomonas sp. LY160]|uniref:putative quinol monooxygenase n=1 Tax=Sphingomonas sp. LY160 TaxID=3095342 RepID=UPI002ADEB302|nr:putative quinol monooxygenase [Sphingomonas sp. LY160]MEA1073295.1 putative quinol monooxygenase [Sphingomonas sp. LY160]
MSIDRRTFVVQAASLAAVTATPSKVIAKGHSMYGLIGKMTAQPGKRDDLMKILLDGVAGMPGCLSYIVAEDPNDTNLIWITEAWESKYAHVASLSLPSVKEAITKGRPLIAAMSAVAETSPIGGHGLAAH